MPADPLPPTIAARWRPMWHPWAHPTRPWWRKAENPYSSLGGIFGGSGAPRPLENAWQRVDRRVVATVHPLTERGRANESVVLGWAFLDPEAAKVGKADAGRHPESGPWTTAEEAMAYVDATTPLPAPDPMPGQAWVSGGGTECMIAAVWRDGGSWWVQWASNPDVPALWQPPTSVLVAGPTPWGRDVPWAPMGGP